MLSEAQLEKVLQCAMQFGGDYADIYMEKYKTNSIIVEEDKVEKATTGSMAGAGIRIVNGDKTSFAKTNDVSLEGLLRAADVASRGMKRGTSEQEFNLEKMIESSQTVLKNPLDTHLSEKAKLALEANKTARSVDEKIKQVTVSYGDVTEEVYLANTLGDYKKENRVRTRFTVSTIAKEGDQVQTGYDVIGGTVGMELFDMEDLNKTALRASNSALNLLKAQDTPAGTMPIVISGIAGGTMIHEACGHGLEADLVQRGMSAYADKKGELVASELVSVIDDGTIPGYYGTSIYDDEGQKTRKNVLIKDGVLEGYMYDRITAKKDGVEPSGNGRRDSYSCRPIPRMTNTYVAKGNDDPEKILKSVDKGLFVKRMGGGQVNTATGDYVFDVKEGYMIEKGEIAYQVKGATLTGNGPETLQKVEMVGNDVGFTTGVCGKDGQSAPVTCGQPTLLISELVVGGSVVK